MGKIILMGKPEVSVTVTEEKKGKQIAVKENNIATLKEFYTQNYSRLQSLVPTETIETENIVPQETITVNDAINDNNNNNNNNNNNTSILDLPSSNNVIEEKVILDQPSVLSDVIMPQNINTSSPVVEPQQVVAPPLSQPTNMFKESDTSGDTPIINLTPDNGTDDVKNEEELDPELLDIKNRLDQVIIDLNNYKKKIKKLEEEVNNNLERSKEVLKDTQAAAQIMSIQQERQRKITEEMNGKAAINDDSTRMLQKDVV